MRITKDNQICKHEDWWCVTPRTGDVWPRELVMCDPEDWWCVTPRAGDVWSQKAIIWATPTVYTWELKEQRVWCKSLFEPEAPALKNRLSTKSGLGGFESSSGHQNVSIGPTMPKGMEWYLYLACCGAVLGSLDMLGYGKTKSLTGSQEAALKFVGPEPALGISRQDIRWRIRRWLVNQHWVWWRGLGDTQRQARELISGPCLGDKARFLSFNRTQSRVVTGLLTGNNTLRRHLYLMGLINNLTCRKCGTEEETSIYILCECEALASLRHAYVASFFLDPENITNLSLI